MRPTDRHIYRTFEEFEREELRRIETVPPSVDEMMTVFAEEASGEPSRRKAPWDDDQ